ncbi:MULTISPECIES: Rieske 2Fe-2S domain-containing protein [Burkholderia]|uniref:Rieske 2Fe-2S domain-containing protein n=1 Tax=Burkholderia TaxID=32008 RepID=UPI0005313D55|nr:MULTISPECIES: Rieske 2Fe-2S domain-containing protein [Burkholderia]AOJ71513.1 hypothetical protein WS78_22115 [Burkholderia savannae]KGS04690.1 rieske [2Fe-2S] domain protein [Burkholderia sp. ABCPW 111]KVG37093.1 hypothetical protein WS77_22865 [Burkholderia sp. MSMB0265]KVG77719.1 hypothetical protein WS81_18130 [Burkholderia sp. MSMB2040]KVG94151.1 hypothetical protein WS83_00310 [Burkholderia sp. MSMB2042]
MHSLKLKITETDTTHGNRPRQPNDDLRKNWWPVAYSHDVGSTLPHGISLFGEPLALFRNASGRVQCLQDLCPHKSVPLSIGTVEDGHIVCRYHGWQFNGAGQCSHPSGMSNRMDACRYSYPALDDGLLIWIYPDASEPIPFVQPLTRLIGDDAPLPACFRADVFDFNQPWDLWTAGFLDLLHTRHVHRRSVAGERHQNLRYHYDPELSPAATLAQPHLSEWYAVHIYLLIVPTREHSNRHFLMMMPSSKKLATPLAKVIFNLTTPRKAFTSAIAYEDFYVAEKQFERLQQGASRFGIGGTSQLSDKFVAWYREHYNDKVWFKRYGPEGVVLDALDSLETRLTRTQKDTAVEIASMQSGLRWNVRDIGMESQLPRPFTWGKRKPVEFAVQRLRDYVGIALQGKK